MNLPGTKYKLTTSFVLLTVYAMLFVLLGITGYYIVSDSKGAVERSDKVEKLRNKKSELITSFRKTAFLIELYSLRHLISGDSAYNQTLVEAIDLEYKKNGDRIIEYEKIAGTEKEKTLLAQLQTARLENAEARDYMLQATKQNAKHAIDFHNQVQNEKYDSFQNAITNIIENQIAENEANTKEIYEFVDLIRLRLVSLLSATVIILLLLGGAIAATIFNLAKSNRQLTAQEQKLQESIKETAEYKYALDRATIVEMADSEGRITYVNDNFCHTTKYSREELIGQDHSKLNSGHHPKEFFAELWSTIKAGNIWRGEVRNRAKDGSHFWVESTVIPFINENGRPFKYLILRTNITERKNFENQLRATEMQYRDLFSKIQDGIYKSTPEGKFVEANPALVQMLGYGSREELLEINIKKQLYFHESERVRALQQSAGGETSIFRLKKKNGAEIWIEERGNIITDQSGKPIFYEGIVRDITERRKYETKLAASEAFSKGVLASLSSHIAVLDEEGNIVAVNKAWDDFALQNGDTTLSRTSTGSNYFTVCQMAEMRGDEIAGRALRGIRSVLFDTNANFEMEYPCHSTTQQRWFVMRVMKFKSTRSLVVIAHENITTRKLAENERSKMIGELVHRNKDLEQFSYIVSHNLRLPLANIIGISDALRIPNISDTTRADLENGLTESVKRLDNVILDLNKILQVKKNVNERKEIVFFDEVIKDIKLSIKNMIEKEQAEINFDFSEVPQIISINSYVYSILYNLISNSIKYRRSNANPLITIKAQNAGNGKMIINYTDNGRGIDLKTKGDQVFGLYKRFHTDVEGKGMGLFMVKAQVETLGGKISIASRVNEGTEFLIELNSFETE